MAYSKFGPASVLKAFVKCFYKKGYFRSLAKQTLDFEYEQNACASLKKVELHSLIGKDQTIDIALNLASTTWGETPLVDMQAICTLIRLISPKSIFEFGTFTGRTTLNMARNLNEAGRINTLDLPPDSRTKTDGLDWESQIADSLIGSAFRNLDIARKITQLFSDSRTFDTTPYRGVMDFVFVDACHEYEFVKSDTKKAFEMVSPGGVVAWHDVSRVCPGVGQCLAELTAAHEIGPPEICLIRGTQVAFCQTPGGTQRRLVNDVNRNS